MTDDGLSQERTVTGLPLGVEYEQHSLQAGITRQITDNLRANLQYVFAQYYEPTSGTINDYTAHEGSLYGFDPTILSCVDLETGERCWKGGRYGAGQLLLLPDAAQLLVTAENGDLVLVRASPERHEELTRMKVFEGKTWNHPVLVGDRLYLRNAEEAVALEMPLG